MNRDYVALSLVRRIESAGIEVTVEGVEPILAGSAVKMPSNWTGWRLYCRLECRGPSLETTYCTPLAKDLFFGLPDRSGETVYQSIVGLECHARRQELEVMPIADLVALADFQLHKWRRLPVDKDIRRDIVIVLAERLTAALDRGEMPCSKADIVQAAAHDALGYYDHADVDDLADAMGIEKPSEAVRAWEGMKQAAAFFLACGMQEEDVVNLTVDGE